MRTPLSHLLQAIVPSVLVLTSLWGQQPAPTVDPARARERDLIYEKEKPFRKPASPSTAIPRSYALIVGIADYKNLPKDAQLKYSERDAESIYSILISPEGGNFKAENVHRLVGPKATRDNIRRELEEWLPSVSKPDDRVIIYFAGHGFVDPKTGKGFLAPYDVEMTRLAATGYPMDSLGDAIGSKIKGKWKVLLTDACHSGAIMPAQDAAQLSASLGNLNPSLFSLTASRDREQSFESPDFGGGHGVFTYYVVKAFEGQADASRDGIVTADELQDYVYRNVREATQNRQTPNSGRGSFDPQMLLAYVPSGADPATPPPPQNGGLIITSNMDGVEVYVDGNPVGVVTKAEPLRLPGLKIGTHTIKGVKLGYEPDGPREETVYPGQETTVGLKIAIPQRRKKAAVDRLEKGIELYLKRFKGTLQEAAVEFQKALEIEPAYSQAALYLARTYNALYENDKAQQWFKRALELDPDYLEARASYGAMLLDLGDLDEAIRQLNRVVQRDPKHALAHSHMAQAYFRKGLFPDAIESARQSIALAPRNAEAHLWLADSLRANKQYADSLPEYESYLALSDFDSKLAGQLNYYAVGFLFGMGKRKLAAQKDIWKELRSAAYLGMCDSERRLRRVDSAIAACQQAIAYDREDPLAHFALGLAHAVKAQETGALESVAAATREFEILLRMNQDLEESQRAKTMLASFNKALAGQ